MTNVSCAPVDAYCIGLRQFGISCCERYVTLTLADILKKRLHGMFSFECSLVRLYERTNISLLL